MDEQLLFTDRIEFRNWLIRNHNNDKGSWLIFSKENSFKSIKANEALEEALCFGWIDGQIKSIDETKYLKRFAPRRNGSKWSEKNRMTALKLIEKGLMTEKGLEAIEQAKKDGTWDIPKAEPINNEQIAFLMRALKGFEPAFTNFINMSPSVKRTYTAHYLSAKSEAIRKKRLGQIVERLNDNKKPM